MTEEKKRGRGRPKGAPNKPKMELVTERVRLTNNADVYEILCQTDLVLAESEENAITGLQVFSDRNGAVKPVLQWLFDDKIVSQLPEGKTPYGENSAPGPDLTETALRFEFKKFKYFVTEQVPPVRREAMWIQLLEGIPAKEAELLDLVKDKVNPFKNIDKKFVQKAFPNTVFN
jgi:hypothetical protein